VRQSRNAHPRSYHLNQQQRVVDALQRRADACWLQKVPPDIKPLALHRVDQQRFAGDIFRRNTGS